MNDDEYPRMAELEPAHWWYRGLRDLLDRVLRARRLTAHSGLRVLDAGCGTGENLRRVGETLQTAYLGGFDISPLAVEFARRKVPRADIYLGDLCDPPLRCGAYELILSCDVLCTTGVEAAREGLQRLADHLSPGGLLILNLPAYRWLYSQHDVAVGTRQRFTAAGVRSLCRELGLQVELLTYRLCPLLPAVVLARLPSLVRKLPAAAAARSDLAPVAPRINGCLIRVLQGENALIVRGARLPWGSSVFAVASRRDQGA